MKNQLLVDWTVEQIAAFGQRAMVAKHRLQELDLFSDAELIDVLENHPRDQFQAFTMGNNPSNIHEWQPVDVSGLTGKDMLWAITRGRFWFHLFRMQNVNRKYRELSDQLFSELAAILP